MAMFLDARVPVLLDAQPQPGDTILAETGTQLPPGLAAAAWFEPAQDHPAGCACCIVRSPSAMALAGLFAARARGGVPFFRRVVGLACSPLGAAELRAALDDPLISGRFRLGLAADQSAGTS